jgi:putative acetyltransferase
VRRSHAVGLGISVARHAHGQGVGSALMRALTEYADQWGHILRIELTVFADNARAIALYERFGFEHEGLHRGFALRNGQYSGVLSMARLHPNPPRWTGNLPARPDAPIA